MKATPKHDKPSETEKIGLTMDECAELLGVSPRSIWTLINTGELPSFRVRRAVRVLRESLEEFARNGGTR
ncbi:MAG: helix-turn-helix domain-containing protein [Pirellula sp.]|jgi:excisionase family DNA binding protein|nr:helix-turn-helix domain-containing protein [Pirellula sp.]